MTNKASQQYWEDLYDRMEIKIIPPADIVRQWFERHIPAVSPEQGKTCIEIGCYPGRYLAVFGEMGYQLYGIDTCKQLQRLPQGLQALGYQVGQFWDDDFLTFDPGMKFDVVTSFGFVEHFTEFRAVLKQHLALVKEGGYLVLTVPNFLGGFQQWLHKNFDRLNYDRHYIPAMDLNSWQEVLRDKDFQIIYNGYFGPFRYWTESQDRGLWARFVLKVLGKLSPLLEKTLPPNKKFYAPYGGVILKKSL